VTKKRSRDLRDLETLRRNYKTQRNYLPHPPLLASSHLLLHTQMTRRKLKEKIG
jgi:hypothetical protein